MTFKKNNAPPHDINFDTASRSYVINLQSTYKEPLLNSYSEHSFQLINSNTNFRQYTTTTLQPTRKHHALLSNRRLIALWELFYELVRIGLVRKSILKVAPAVKKTKKNNISNIGNTNSNKTAITATKNNKKTAKLKTTSAAAAKQHQQQLHLDGALYNVGGGNFGMLFSSIGDVVCYGTAEKHRILKK